MHPTSNNRSGTPTIRRSLPEMPRRATDSSASFALPNRHYMNAPPDWKRLDDVALARARALLSPWERVVDPVFSGLENIPDSRPLLFVGNHTLFGVLDVPLMFFKLLDGFDIHLRVLGDRLHFRVPLWRTMLERFGGIEGTPENCDRLMQAGECVLVFPGGAREVAKRRGEQYQLVWGDRAGFARHALRNGCTIVPFAAVGAEDMFHIVADADNYLASRVGGLLKRMGIREDILIPLAIPKQLSAQNIERFYFHFMPPIHVPPADTVAAADFDAMAWTLREHTRESVEMGIEYLLEARKNDPYRTIPSRSELSARGA